MLEILTQGTMVAVVGMGVVFGALLLLVVTVIVTRHLSRLSEAGKHKAKPAPVPPGAEGGRLPGEVVAAMAVALLRRRTGTVPARITQVRRSSPEAWRGLPAEDHWDPQSEVTP